MMHTERIHTRRLLAVVLTLAMLLSAFSVPASAQEDWSMLSVTLSWTDMEGNTQFAQAMPVDWSGDQSFWVQVDPAAPLDGLTLTLSHPNHMYSFDPADGSMLPMVMDAGSAMDMMNVIVITAYENEAYADTFNLYVSTSMAMPEQTTGAAQTDVTVYYQKQDTGETFGQTTQTCYQNQDNPVYAAEAPEGYELSGDSVVNVTVDASGNASVNPVTFYYTPTQVAPAQTEVVVYYQKQDTGEVFGQTTQTCYQNQDNPVYAAEAPEGYELSGDSMVNVTVDASGNASVNPVTFYYTPTQVAPAQTDVVVYYQKQDTGEVFGQTTQTCYQNQDNPVYAAEAPDGYELSGDSMVNVTVDASGNASVNPVYFNYTPVQTAPVTTDVTVYYVGDGDVQFAQGTFPCTSGQPNYVTPDASLTAGWTLTSTDSVPVDVDANGVATPATVTFNYTKANTSTAGATVEVYYQDDQGHDVADFQTVPVSADNPVVSAAPTNLMAGYTLTSEPSMPVKVENGVADPSTITFYYKLTENQPAVTAKITLRYLDAADQTTEVASSQETTLYEGTYPVNAAPADLKEGYSLSGSGTQDVTVYSDGNTSAANNQVVFLYQKNETPAQSATITVYYKGENDEDIAGPFQPTLPGGVATVVVPDMSVIPAEYEASDASPVSVNVTREGVADPATVTFRFKKKVVETPIPVGVMINRFGVTNAKQVHWRDRPSTSGKDQGTFAKGSYIWLIQAETNDAGEEWTRVLVDGKQGYVMSKFVDVLTQAESDAYQQAELETPVPTDLATATPETTAEPPTNAPTAEPTKAPTEEPTKAPTAEPTLAPADPTQTPTLEPTKAPVVLTTDAPAPYTGYALTTTTVALRTGISTADDTIITRLEANTLLRVSGQNYDSTGKSWSVGTTLDNVTGMVPDDSTRRITDEEADYYIRIYNDEHATPTPSPTVQAVVTAEPMQRQGYAVTVGDDVYFRNMPSTMSDIKDVLASGVVVYVNGQQYVDGVAWHIVQYKAEWGYIRADLLRMMTVTEENNYLNSLATPAPTLITTPQPYDQNSLSSYGYVSSSTVNFRTSASSSASRIKTLKRYAFCLVLGTTDVNGTTWYRVNYGGTIGYIQGNYFKQMTITELEDFLNSAEYTQGITNNATSTVTNNTSGSTSSGSTGSGVVSAEDQTVNTWTNPNSGVNVSYEPFDPFATTAPIATESASPSASAEVSESPAATTLEPIATVAVEYPTEDTQSGGSAVGWIIAIAILLLGGGGGAYAYVLHRQNQRKAAQRAAQRRAAAQRTGDGRPYARSAGTAPGQTQTQPRTGTYANQNGTARPGTPGTQPPQARRPYPAGTTTATQPGQRPASGTAPTGYMKPTGATQPGTTGQRPAAPTGASDPAHRGTTPARPTTPTGAQTAAPYTASYRPTGETQTATPDASAYRPTTPTGAQTAAPYTASYRPTGETQTTTPDASAYRPATPTGAQTAAPYTASYRPTDEARPTGTTGRRSAYRAGASRTQSDRPTQPGNDDFADDNDGGDM